MAQAVQTLVCISSFPGLETSRRRRSHRLNPILLHFPPPTRPALRPASNACTEQHKDVFVITEVARNRKDNTMGEVVKLYKRELKSLNRRCPIPVTGSMEEVPSQGLLTTANPRLVKTPILAYSFVHSIKH